MVTKQVSCDVLPNQARLPKVKFLLAGLGNHPSRTKKPSTNRGKQEQRFSGKEVSAPSSSSSSSSPPERREFHRGGSGVGDTKTASPLPVNAPRGSVIAGQAREGSNLVGDEWRVGKGRSSRGKNGGESGGGLYLLLQGAFDEALVSTIDSGNGNGNGNDRRSQPSVTAPSRPTRGTGDALPATSFLSTDFEADAGLLKHGNSSFSRSNDGGGLRLASSTADPNRTSTAEVLAHLPSPSSSAPPLSSGPAATATQSNNNKKKGKKKEAKGSSSTGSRSEIGAGRALFGGFVPLRNAPAASLYDFGTQGGQGSDRSGVASLGSIYGSGVGRNYDPAVGLGGGGSLATLDEARVRQYTQEATSRAQRLGAEKRSSKISRSKKQG